MYAEHFRLTGRSWLVIVSQGPWGMFEDSLTLTGSTVSTDVKGTRGCIGLCIGTEGYGHLSPPPPGGGRGADLVVWPLLASLASHNRR